MVLILGKIIKINKVTMPEGTTDTQKNFTRVVKMGNFICWQATLT